MQVTRNSPYRIPDALRRKLLGYRRRVWGVKVFEAVATAVVGVLVGFLIVFALDRFVDTPQVLRALVFACSLVCCGLVPLAIERWVFRRRRLDQLAKLLAKTLPRTGDQLLGVIELAEGASGQSHSPELVQAAIEQVAEKVACQDLRDVIPRPQHKQRGGVAFAFTLVALLLFMFNSSASTNAWARFVSPWKETPRYTYASVEPLPETLVVPHGEPFNVQIQLNESTQWMPATAKAMLAGQNAKQTDLVETGYVFDLPAQVAPIELDVTVGDFQGHTSIAPMARPELKTVKAEIALPAYLGRDESLKREIRGASVSVVRGSETTFVATVSRSLSQATVNGRSTVPAEDQFSTTPFTVQEPLQIEMEWQDHFRLSGQKPFQLSVDPIDDEPPSLVCESLPRKKVLLDSEVLSFQVRAYDDFGIKKVGIEWQGLDEAAVELAAGEAVIGAGDRKAEFLKLAATFCAKDRGVSPQRIAFRVFVEDYLPGRERAYSPTCVFEVLDPEQHFVWITSQLTRWHRMSLDVRDRELQLFQRNKQLRDLPQQDLSRLNQMRELALQADRERANGRRLSDLLRSGESLLKEAMRNKEIGVGYLDQWAEMMITLKEISENRMPTVADLLKQASKAGTSSGEPNEKSRGVGQNRVAQNAEAVPGGKTDEEGRSSVPTIIDIESTQNEPESSDGSNDPSKGNPNKPRLTLPTTDLVGNEKSDEKTSSLSGEKTQQAVKEQGDLLAEFDKIADELNAALANLEGSTLVKRLKASSRQQQQVASKLAALAARSFGISEHENEHDAAVFGRLAETEVASSQETSYIMDDMAAYFDRSRMRLFGRVLDDMRKQDVPAELRLLGDELRQKSGLSISQAEYWSDTFDRWAEDLVEVTKNGACPGGKAKGSLPPSIVLEVLQLLEGEVQLREQTRVAEQARPAVSDTQHLMDASRLSDTQNEFYARMDKVVSRILELPEALADFDKELSLLSEVTGMMREATEVLAKPETGSPAIAVETEIIELLLKSKRFNPSGGGGRLSPGGGGGGDTEAPALALVGAGVNEKEVREVMSATQSTGAMGAELPDEYRSGLDEYFNWLEIWKTN